MGAEATSAAVTTTPEPAATPKSGIALQRTQKFSDLLERHGGLSEAGESSDAPADDDAPSDETPKKKPAKEKPKAKPKAAPAKAAPAKDAEDKPAKPTSDASKKSEPADDTAKLTQLKTLAKDLGLEVDSGRVTHADYKELRLWKDRQVNQLKQREAHLKEQERQLIQQIREAKDEADKHISASGERLSRAEKVLAAYDAGDPDGFAQALGKKDWNEIQEDFIAKNSDPNYKRLRELERREQEREERDKRAQEEATQAEEQAKIHAETHAEQERRQRARDNYRGELTESMKKSTNRIVREMADDPIFVNTIFMIQEDNYDPSTRRTVTPEQALRMTVNGGKSAVIEALKEQRARLNRALEEIDAPAPAKPDTNRLGAKPRPKSAPVSPAEKQTSPPARMKLKSPEWKNYARERLADAIDNERRSLTRNRGDDGG